MSDHPLSDPVRSNYGRILAVVDLTEDSDQVIARALSVAHCHGARLQLLHVLEYIPVEPMGDALLPAVQIEEDLLRRARQRMSELAAAAGVDEQDWFVEAGNVKTEIVRAARAREADLVVLGSRERHGLANLLNFTEDSVLHAACCDVLAVRLRG